MLLVLVLCFAAGGCVPQPAGPPPSTLPRSLPVLLLAGSPGDSVAIPVAWLADGGTITALGLYTAGKVAGSYRITATAGRLRARVTVTVAAPAVATTAPSPTQSRAPSIAGEPAAGVGIPFGPFTTRYDSGDDFTLYFSGQTPGDIVGRMREARRAGRKLMLAMTGGAHRRYMTDGVFDMGKWMREMGKYDTPRIREAVAAAVADGTIIGNSVMDEPHNVSPDNRWGPAGTMNKGRVDTMCAYVKRIFPTLRVGVVHDYRVFDPGNTYSSCEFVVSQYREAKGPVGVYRDGGLAFARRNGISIAFSMNILDGGSRVKGCPVPQTGGPGTSGANCRMRPDQVREYGLVLGPAGCAFTMWRFDSAFMAQEENRRAFKDIAARLATLPARSCGRT